MLHADLKVTSGKQAGSLIQLPIGKFLIGREEDCQLRPNSDLVSRHHCVFTVDQYSVRLRDLGSTNGTLVNGDRIRNTVVLKNGDRVSIGKLDFELVVHETAGDETTPEMSLDTDTSVPAPKAPVTADASGEISTSDTMTDFKIPAEAAAQAESAPQPTFAQPAMGMAPAGMPPVGDTQYLGMVPGQPQMGYPMAYPGQYMQPYGFPGYPPQMYPQMGYPPMGGMYPQPGMMPPQGYPMQAPMAPPVEEAPPASSTDLGDSMSVRLPDPESTGAKPPEPKKEAAPGAPKEAKFNTTAADIIKKYQQRKPI